jgi:FkbH-like protein
MVSLKEKPLFSARPEAQETNGHETPVSGRLNVGILADFNASNFARLLEKQGAGMAMAVSTAPFGQVMQTLLQPSVDFWSRHYDVLIVWASPQAVVPRFQDVLDFKDWSNDGLYQGVDAFSELVRGVEDRTGSIFLPSWVSADIDAHRPSVEMKSDLGASAALLRMNLRLIENVTQAPGVVVFNTERWLRQGGVTAFSDKLWYLSKTPYSNAVFEEAAKDMVSTLRGLRGLSKKVVILDLDNTLWGGIVGDAGWENLRVGGHDPVGEAFAQFQRELIRLSKQGVVLAVVSKNEESVALAAIDSNPEMILRSRDFAAWRINWADKAQNIVEVMSELSLPLDSAVFLDDSPHERNRVRQALSDLLVPEWPADPMDYARALRQLRCFESTSLSGEDRSRTAMYVSDRTRRERRGQSQSVEEWLETLGLEVEVAPLSVRNLERTTQLLNKTNQMNLTTRRMSVGELDTWASKPNHHTLTFRVRDNIGDYGLCGIASLVLRGSTAQLVDFILSCRAMGRGIEETIISVVATEARKFGVEELVATYVATPKNRPCLRWLEDTSPFTASSRGEIFALDVSREIPSPKHIRVTFPPS